MNELRQTLLLKDTIQLGKEIAEQVKTGGVICLYGDLGSGKTTFTQSLAASLGISKHLTSPTFLVMRTYEIPNSPQILYHLDLYRLNEPQEMIDIGLTDLLKDPQAIVVIEWSEKLGELLPEKHIAIHFEYIDEERRKVTLNDYR